MYYKRYKRLKEQVSTDGGITWSDTGVYKKGDLIDTGDWDSKEDCEIGYYPPYSILYSTNELENTSSPFWINYRATGIYTKPNVKNELVTFNVGSGLTSLSGFSRGITNLASVEFVGEWDCTNLKAISSLFSDCTNIETIKGLEKLNPENVTSMGSMFRNCESITELDLTSWSTHNVENMNSMFYFCRNLEKVNLTSFTGENLTDVFLMFNGCSSLKEVDLSNLNTEKITEVGGMFQNCENLERLNLTKFDITNVSSQAAMFHACNKINYIKCTKVFKDWCESKKNSIQLYNFDAITWDIV